jgi:hypothetical protein
LQDTYALLVADGGSELIHTPLARPEMNQLFRAGHFTLAADGTISGEIVETRSGDHAFHERASLIHVNQQQRTEEIENRLSRSLKGFTLENVDVKQLEQTEKNLEIVLKLNNPGYGQIRGPLMLLRPRVIGENLLPAARVEELRKMQGIIGADENAAVVLKRKLMNDLR